MSTLEIAPDAPWIAHAAAAAALALHVGGGSVAIASGYVSIFATKGGRLHRLSGKVFFVAMLAMAGIGAIVSPMLDEAQWTNTTAAVFTLYLTLTAWLTARRRPGEAGRAEVALIVVPVGIAALGLYWAVASGGSGAFGVVYAFGAIGALAAARDVALVRAGGIVGVARTSRHLWRMSLALFVATGSFFFGQPEFQPDWLRATPLPMIIGLGPLALMAFWLVRVRLPRRRRAAAT